MTELKVYAVERDCIDPRFEAYTVAIFSTEERASEWIAIQPKSDREKLNIAEYELDEAFNTPAIEE